jgi:hypothetical protein
MVDILCLPELTLFTEPLPFMEELASLVLLVLYIDQLQPETEETLAPYAWHTTTDFAHDFQLVTTIANGLCKFLKQKEQIFAKIFQEREHEFIRLCRTMEKEKLVDELVVINRHFASGIFGEDELLEESNSSIDETSEGEETTATSDERDIEEEEGVEESEESMNGALDIDKL